MIKTQIIADSMSPMGHRITTFVLVFPRIVLAEFNTHRMLSRNSASSRAIPFEKMLKMVKENPFIPIKWMKEHKGMQGNEYIENEFTKCDLVKEWLKARDYAIEQATILSTLGLTKQVVNRLLEPFMWHTVIVTGTEWENFFALRAHPQAEIHIQALAHQMLEVYNQNTPKQLKEDEWHIPFGDTFDEIRLQFDTPNTEFGPFNNAITRNKIRIATARCARVSYMNFEGKDDYETDIKLYNTLLSSGHMSPFEHCAKCMTEDEHISYMNGKFHPLEYSSINGWCGNFRGFIQLRKTLEGENKNDSRVIKK